MKLSTTLTLTLTPYYSWKLGGNYRTAGSSDCQGQPVGRAWTWTWQSQRGYNSVNYHGANAAGKHTQPPLLRNLCLYGITVTGQSN